MQSPTEQKKYYENEKKFSLAHTHIIIQIHRENRHKNIYLVQPPDRANGRSANHEFPSEWHRQHKTHKKYIIGIRIAIRRQQNETKKKQIEKKR